MVKVCQKQSSNGWQYLQFSNRNPAGIVGIGICIIIGEVYTDTHQVSYPCFHNVSVPSDSAGKMDDNHLPMVYQTSIEYQKIPRSPGSQTYLLSEIDTIHPKDNNLVPPLHVA